MRLQYEATPLPHFQEAVRSRRFLKLVCSVRLLIAGPKYDNAVAHTLRRCSQYLNILQHAHGCS